RGATDERVLSLLEKVARGTDASMVRQHLVILVWQAQAHFDEKNYRAATQCAVCALEKSREIRSRSNRDRIEALYQQLLTTAFHDKPLLAHLGMKLRMWDHGSAKDPIQDIPL